MIDYDVLTSRIIEFYEKISAWEQEKFETLPDCSSDAYSGNFGAPW